ncbi:MAG: hypothetical protein ACI82Q_000912 [Nonlabens sp.]|jgi:hypothetical protein
MKVSVIVYSRPQESLGLASFKNQLKESALRYYATDLLFDKGYFSFREFQEALKRTCSILETKEISIQENIRSTFRGENYLVYRDWKLSALALHLLKINGDPKNKCVASYQLQSNAALTKT